MAAHRPRRPLDSRPTVLVAITDGLAAGRAETACRLAGTTPRRVRRITPGERALHDADGLIWDALPPEQAAPRLRALRHAHPDLPIVLHPPAGPGVEALAVVAAGIPRTGLYAQWDRHDDTEQLAELLEHHLATAPERIVGLVLDALLEEAPSRPHAFARAVLHARATGRACTVTDAARTLGVGADRLRRRWPPAPFPKPKELSAAVTLLYATYVRDWSGASWAAVAQASGLEPDTLRRLRKAWFPTGDASPPFDAVCLRWAERLRVPTGRVRRMLEELPDRGVAGAAG